MFKELTSPVDVTVTKGTAWLRFQGGVPQQVAAEWLDACYAAGIHETTTAKAPDAFTADTVQQLVKIMFEILAEGDPRQLTTDLEPRFEVLQRRTPFKFTKAERESAWAIVKGDRSNAGQ